MLLLLFESIILCICLHKNACCAHRLLLSPDVLIKSKPVIIVKLIIKFEINYIFSILQELDKTKEDYPRRKNIN